jgi:hypothetical protein
MTNRMSNRIALVEEHLRAENAHDVNAIMVTFGSRPKFVLNGASIDGRDGIENLYAGFGFADSGAFSNLSLKLMARHVAEDSITVEVMLSGRHVGDFQGIAATNRTFELPLCAVITFDAEEKMAGERVYFDGSLLLKQLGVL